MKLNTCLTMNLLQIIRKTITKRQQPNITAPIESKTLSNDQEPINRWNVLDADSQKVYIKIEQVELETSVYRDQKAWQSLRFIGYTGGNYRKGSQNNYYIGKALCSVEFFIVNDDEFGTDKYRNFGTGHTEKRYHEPDGHHLFFRCYISEKCLENILNTINLNDKVEKSNLICEMEISPEWEIDSNQPMIKNFWDVEWIDDISKTRSNLFILNWKLTNTIGDSFKGQY